jgi:hypothetical protein
MIRCLSFKHKGLDNLNLNNRLKEVKDIWVINFFELAYKIHRVFVLFRIHIRDINKDSHRKLLRLRVPLD